jgi:hypothetical protein
MKNIEVKKTSEKYGSKPIYKAENSKIEYITLMGDFLILDRKNPKNSKKVNNVFSNSYTF